MRPILARIDTAALTHNLMVARRLAGRNRVLAVVKANGYGHGLSRVARALRGADGFAVLSLDEAATLRAHGYTHPIVLLEGFFHADEIPEIARRRVLPVIHREDQIDALAKARPEHKIDVFLKLDTGMHRLGLAPAPWLAARERLQAIPHVGSITLMTHFARADEPDVGVETQLAVFKHTTHGLSNATSLGNSATLIRHPDAAGDWARPGIMLYGASPFADQIGGELGLRPTMHLTSELIATRQLRRGDGVGYGHVFVAPQDMRIGVVACGYADGYPRHAGTGTPVMVDGRHTRTLGRVSMDMLYVDLSGIPDAHVGSRVTLWGEGVPIESVATAAGTISYELLTALAPRVRIEEA